MEHFQTNWKSMDGIDIFAQGWTPTGIPARVVVCLVHGMGEHTSRYQYVAKTFTDSGFVLFGADLRGHGHSGGARGHFPSIEIVHKDIELLLEKAKELYPGLPIILYGHSLGGILVLNFGLKSKTDVKGIISTSPALHNALEKQPIKLIAAKVLGTVIPTLSIRNGLDVNALSHDKDVVNSYLKDQLVHDKISLGFGKIMIQVDKWTLAHAREFAFPLLLMHGKDDSIAYPTSSIEFAASVQGNCKLILWDNGYHELHNEPFKDEVIKAMIEWMQTILLPGV